MGPVIVISANNFASAILIEAGLSYLDTPQGKAEQHAQSLAAEAAATPWNNPSPMDITADKYRSGAIPLPAGWRLEERNGSMMPIAPDGSQRWPEEMTPFAGSNMTQQQWDQISRAGTSDSLAPGTVVPQYGTMPLNALVSNIQNRLGSQQLTPDLVRQYASDYHTTPQQIGEAFKFTPEQVNQFMGGPAMTTQQQPQTMAGGGAVLGALGRACQ